MKISLCQGLLFLFFIASSFQASSVPENNSPYLHSNKNVVAYRFFKEGEYLKAYEQAISAKQDAIKQKDSFNLARAISNIASTHLVLGNTEKALVLYLESLKISRENTDIVGEESTLNNIATIYKRLGEFDESLKYLNQLPIINGIERPSYQKMVAYHALLDVYIEKNQLSLARETADLLADLFIGSDEHFGKFYFYTTYVRLLFKEGSYVLADQIIDEAERISIENQFAALQVIAIGLRVERLIDQGYFERAKKEVNRALEIAEQLGLLQELVSLHKLSFVITKKQNRFNEALKTLELIRSLEVSISGEKIKQLAEITKIDRQVTETEEKLIQSKKDQQILSLQLDHQKQAQWIWIASILALTLTVGLFYYLRTSRRELQSQQQVNDQLVELDRVKDRVLSNTSHELRTPLNGIIGLSEIMLHDEQNSLTDSDRDSIRLIKSSGEQLALVVNDILELSKVKSDTITPKLSEFDLMTVVDDVVAVCKPDADKKGIAIIVENYLSSSIVILDRARIQQILFNIIGNAVKFTEQGHVQVQLDRMEDELNITVSDTGIGIPSANIERVFEGFEQVDAGDSRAQQGSGLGLAISRGLVEALGGSLTLHSVLGDGTQVNLNLPLTVDSE